METVDRELPPSTPPETTAIAQSGSEQSLVEPVGIINTQQANAAPEQPLYDADAEQTFKFMFQGRGRNQGKEYPVLITFGPVKDNDYIAYDKQRDVRMSGEADGIATSNESFGAALWLGKKQLVRVVGWGKEDGSDLSDERLVDAVQTALLAADIEPTGGFIEGDADADNPWKDDAATDRRIRLRCIAEGRLIVTEHTPGDDLDPEVFERMRKRYNSLKRKGKLVEGDRISRLESKLPSRAEEKGKIYDGLHFTATGYSGRVPLWHKEKVIDDYYEVEQELTEGK